VPEKAYGAAKDYYVGIQDTSFSFAPDAVTPPTTLPLQPKAIQELYETNYGRMNATLGVELPFTNVQIQTTIPYGYVDPPTETINNGETQIWKITHNGVDTHAIHFHLFTVQVINRVDWDGAIRPPEPNELGWKDTVRMNPLEDAIAALRPYRQNLPWPLPDSIRPLDVTMPLGSTGQFMNIDPITNNLITVTNELTNFGWEYVWHCHLLGHEENDMMRPIVFQVPPEAPSNLVATPTTPVNLTWTDNSASETGFTLQRATDAGFTTNVTTFTVPPKPGFGGSVAFTDTTVEANMTYHYQVQAFNAQAYAFPPQNATTTLTSAWSNTVTVTLSGTGTVPVVSLSPTSLSFGNQALGTTSAAKPVKLTNSGLAPLTITSITTSGTHAQTNNCVSPLAAGAFCTINVTFTPPPTVAGGQSGTLTIVDNAPGSPHTVALSGTGQ
jgi:hypothetical protein